MPACPACKAPLRAGANAGGACPHCGVALPSAAAEAPAPYAAPLPESPGFDLAAVPDLELPASPVAPARPQAPPPPARRSSRPPPQKVSAAGAAVAAAGGGRDLDDDVFGTGAGDLGALELDVAAPPPSAQARAVEAVPPAPPSSASAVSNPRLPVAHLGGVPAAAPSAPAVEAPEIDPREARAFAGYEDAPSAFFLWPVYAFQVTRRRIELARDASAMRRAYALLPAGPAAEEQRKRIALTEAALAAHDARAFVWGWSLAVGSVVLVLVVLFFPLLYRAIVHVEPPRLEPPPPG